MLRFIFLFSILILCGRCARVPDADLAQTIEAPDLLGLEDRAFNNDSFQRGEWPEQKWWEMFSDPQLNALIEQALSNNYTLKQAHARVEYSRQVAKINRSKLFPHLSGNYVEQWEYLSKYGFDRDFFPIPPESTQEIPHTLNQIDLTLDFSYEFDFFGKNRNLLKAALGRAKADEAEEKQAQLITEVLVAQTYFSWQTKYAQLDIQRERLEEKKRILGCNVERSEWGLIDDFALYNSDKEICQIQQAIAFLEEGIALDKHMLKYLTALGPDDSLLQAPPTAHFNHPFPLPENISSDLLARRPDLAAQIWRVEAAAKEIGAAKADFYPNVNLSAFAGLESLQFSNLFRDSKQGGLVPAIHLPIFTAGRLRAQLRSKVAQFNQAVYVYNDLVLSAAKEVADYIAIVKAINEAYSQQNEALEDVSAAYALYSARYAKGLDTILTVLSAQDQMLEQRFALVGLYKDHLNAILNLIKKLGGGYNNG